MTERDAKRPAPFRKPPYWGDTPPPRPGGTKDEEELSPTRYGDWVRNGIAIDF